MSTKKDSNGDYIVKRDENTGQHPSLHSGDFLGMGTISFGAYNRYPYVPYIYTNDTTRWDKWTALNSNFKSCAYALCYMGARKYYLPYLVAGPETEDTRMYVKGDGVYWTEDDRGKAFSQSNIVRINNRVSLTYPTENGTKYTSTDTANAILFDFKGSQSNGQTELGDMFKIDTNIRLKPYDFIDVEYYIVQGYPGDTVNGQIFKGDIVLRLYDTTDITGATPIEELPLPAWGAIQNEYGVNSEDAAKNKTVHAWFKIHSQADKVRAIVIHRANPTNGPVEDLKLVLNNILFHNSETLPALGPQMQLRIYPNTVNNLSNTKIRKFGCIYRL